MRLWKSVYWDWALRSARNTEAGVRPYSLCCALMVPIHKYVVSAPLLQRSDCTGRGTSHGSPGSIPTKLRKVNACIGGVIHKQAAHTQQGRCGQVHKWLIYQPMEAVASELANKWLSIDSFFPPKTKKCSRSIYDPLSSRRWDHCSDTSLHLYTLMLQVLGVLSGIEPEAEPAVKRELCSYYTLKQLKNTRWKL